jgi:hypothetical protein
MSSSGMLRRGDLIRTDVPEEPSASIIRVIGIGELGKTLAATSNRRRLVFLRSVLRLLVTSNIVRTSPMFVTLMMKALSSSETSAITRATRRNIPEGAFFMHKSVKSKPKIGECVQCTHCKNESGVWGVVEAVK